MSVNDSIKEQGLIRGQCQICGVKVDGRSYYCASHKSSSAYQQAKGGPVIDIPVDDRNPFDAIKVPNRTPKKVDGDDYWETFGEFFVLLLNMALLSPVGSLPEEIQGKITDECAITNEEMEAVARPLLRMFAKTSISAKYGQSLLQNADIVPAITALMSIFGKIGQIQTIVREFNANQPQSPIAGTAQTNGSSPYVAPPDGFRLVDFGSGSASPFA